MNKTMRVVKESLILANLVLAAVIMSALVFLGASIITRLNTSTPPSPVPAPTIYPSVTGDGLKIACDEMRTNGTDAASLRAYGCPE